MSTNVSKAASAMAKIKTPARARAARENGRLGGRPAAPFSVRTAGGRIVASGETAQLAFDDLKIWFGIAERRAKLFIWRGAEKIGPYSPSRLLLAGQKSKAAPRRS